MKIGHILIIIVVLLSATIVISIPSYHPKPEPVTEGKMIGVGTSDGSEITNRTTALSDGIKGYILARLITKPTGPILAIPANGTLKVQVELWFVSYDWMNATETNVTISSKVAGTPDEWSNFNAYCEPNGNITLRVNEPTVLNVTLSVPKWLVHGVGLGYNNGAPIVGIKSDYTMIDSTNNLYEPKPMLRVQLYNVTDEDSITLKIFNPGPWNIEYGPIYYIEKMVNGSWTPVEDHPIWAMVAISTFVGSEWSQSVNITSLDSGVYRVSKEIEYDGQKQMFYVEFTVRRPLELADRQALVELALSDHVNELFIGVSKGVNLPEGSLILLSTPNLGGVEVPSSVQGVNIRVLTQGEIDALSRVKHVNYMFFDKIVETDSNKADVTLTLIWNYRVGTNDANIIGDSGMIYHYTMQSGNWVITSGFGWVP
ncbi:MAG: immunoglobulin-like domain-containing protein [Candidatus Bathyarchaeia archaeon]|jgi:hypothetical protein